MTGKAFKKWLKERDEIVKRYDVGMFKAFYRKWQALGMYDKNMPLPADDIIEVSLRKMVYHMTSASDTEKAEAEAWLIQHNSTTNL